MYLYRNYIHHAGLECHFHCIYDSTIIQCAMTDGDAGYNAFELINFYSSGVTVLVLAPASTDWFRVVSVNFNLLNCQNLVHNKVLMQIIKCQLMFMSFCVS